MHAWLVQRAVQHQEEVDSEKMMALLRQQDDAFAAQLEDAKAEVEARIVVRSIRPPTHGRPLTSSRPRPRPSPSPSPLALAPRPRLRPLPSPLAPPACEQATRAHFASVHSRRCVRVRAGVRRSDSDAARKQRLKKAMLRWHPDKYVAAHASRISADELAAVVERVTAVMQRVQQERVAYGSAPAVASQDRLPR